MGVNEKSSVEKQLDSMISSKAELAFAAGLFKGSYSSRLEDFSMPDNPDEFPMLGFAHPIFKGSLLPVSRGLEMTVKIEGQGCFYQSEAEVVRSTPATPVPMVWVRLLSGLSRVQRRAFVRVTCSIRARACFVEMNDTEDDPAADTSAAPERRWFPVTIKDISIGGVGAEVQPDEIPLCVTNARYLIQFSIDDTELIMVCQLVKMFSKSDDGSVTVGLSYEGIPAFTEKIMLSFVRQQELRSRG